MQPITLYKYKTNLRFLDIGKNCYVNNRKYFNYFKKAYITQTYEKFNYMKQREENFLHFVIVE